MVPMVLIPTPRGLVTILSRPSREPLDRCLPPRDLLDEQKGQCTPASHQSGLSILVVHASPGLSEPISPGLGQPLGSPRKRSAGHPDANQVEEGLPHNQIALRDERSYALVWSGYEILCRSAQ